MVAGSCYTRAKDGGARAPRGPELHSAGHRKYGAQGQSPAQVLTQADHLSLPESKCPKTFSVNPITNLTAT